MEANKTSDRNNVFFCVQSENSTASQSTQHSHIPYQQVRFCLTSKTGKIYQNYRGPAVASGWTSFHKPPWWLIGETLNVCMPLLSYFSEFPLDSSYCVVSLVTEAFSPLYKRGDCVRARIPLAETGFFTLECGGETTEPNHPFPLICDSSSHFILFLLSQSCTTSSARTLSSEKQNSDRITNVYIKAGGCFRFFFPLHSEHMIKLCVFQDLSPISDLLCLNQSDHYSLTSLINKTFLPVELPFSSIHIFPFHAILCKLQKLLCMKIPGYQWFRKLPHD